ncbi:MAG: hypothetical protein QM755_09975 [Luteolibacter sp.]
MRSDPGAALVRGDELEELPEGAKAAIELWTAEVRSDEILQRLENAKPYRTGSCLREGWLQHLGQSNDLEGLEKLHEAAGKEGGTERYGNFLSMDIARAWPPERAADLLPKALEWRDQKLLAFAIERMPPADVCDRLLADEAEGARLKAGGGGGKIIEQILANTAMSLDQRRALIRKFDPESETESTEFSPLYGGLAAKLASKEAERLDASGDKEAVLSSFKSGFVNPHEALRLLLSAMPDLVAMSLENARETAMGWLMESNPGQAIALLDGLPPRERYLYATRKMAGSAIGVTPEQYYAFQEALPFDPSLGPVSERAGMWRSFMSWRDDSDWLRAWALNLPHGMNRDLLLATYADRFDGVSPDDAALFRSAINHPEALK